MKCIVCDAALAAGLTSWHWTCRRCGYECSDFVPSINHAGVHAELDETRREDGLRALREANFRAIVQRLGQRHGRLLDVGCAHGWFLRAAQADFDVVGIEPDRVIGRQARALGLDVRLGLFPHVLEPGERFDVIVLNDVFEHIPDVAGATVASHAHLASNGRLVLNLPSSSGVFYRIAKLLARIGLTGPFDRMWQKGLPSPHLHYFNPDNLQAFLAGRGFARADAFHVATISSRGLWSRLRFVKGAPLPVSLLQFVAITALLPLLLLLPKDAHVSVFTRPA